MSLSHRAVREKGDAVRRQNRIRPTSPGARNKEEGGSRDNDKAARKRNNTRSRDQRRRRRVDQL